MKAAAIVENNKEDNKETSYLKIHIWIVRGTKANVCNVSAKTAQTICVSLCHVQTQFRMETHWQNQTKSNQAISLVQKQWNLHWTQFQFRSEWPSKTRKLESHWRLKTDFNSYELIQFYCFLFLYSIIHFI